MTQADINNAVRSLAYLKTPDRVRAGVRNTYGYSVPLASVERILRENERRKPAEIGEPKESDGWDYDFRLNRAVPVPAEKPVVKFARPMFRERAPLPKKVPAPSPNPFVGPFQFKVLAASVASDFGVTVADVCGNGRFRKFMLPRLVLTKLCLERGMSCCAIGRKMGGRDHTTILHQRDIFEAYARLYPEVARSYARHVELRDAAQKAVGQ